MAASVLKAALLSRWNIPSSFSSNQANMNTFKLLAVFALGVIFTCIVSILTVYVQQEIERSALERKTNDLIADRRKILEKSHKFILIPDESQLSVVDTEIAIDPALYSTSPHHEAPTHEGKNGIKYLKFIQH